MTAKPTLLESRRRAGFALIEMAVAGVLIAVALTATVQVVGWVALERKAVERRERAILEANNLLERIVARPWADLTPEAADLFAISRAASDSLRHPTLEVKIVPYDDAPSRKKVVVEIRWPDRSGRPEAPVRLVAWTYRREGGKR